MPPNLIVPLVWKETHIVSQNKEGGWKKKENTPGRHQTKEKYNSLSIIHHLIPAVREIR